jgi:hypothetical protein
LPDADVDVKIGGGGNVVPLVVVVEG